MTPQDFIDKWRASELKERSAAQEHFIDLCRLLGEPTPADVDPKGEFYCFERGAAKESGGEGWADVWKRHHFGWEYKGKKKDLEKARDQLRQYAVALENPPLLVVCDTARFIITTNFTNTVQERHELSLEDLLDGDKRALLKAVFSNPEALKPGKTRQDVTEEAAAEFATLAKRLRERGCEPERVAHFVNRLVFCMFAEDVDLLPNKMFQRMLEASEHQPAKFDENARTLFAAMQTGGPVGFESVHWFNGGLFDTDDVIPLEKADIRNLLAAAKLDWSEVDPSILGTLFERGLDPDKRSQLGAHYTDREKIMMIVDPVIKEPLEAEWSVAKAAIEASLAKRDDANASIAKIRENAGAMSASEAKKTEAKRRKEITDLLTKATRAENAAKSELEAFRKHLQSFRVLDPACGSGNFLYLSLLVLKDLEHRANLEAEALGIPRQPPRVGPECVLGIEINHYAAELARVSVWIGEIQWMRKNGFSANTNPVLRPLENIECADALVVDSANGDEWTEKEWPKADVIVGNPPFLGDRRMISVLGEDYVTRLRALYGQQLPGRSDLVCYWFAKALKVLTGGAVKRVGFVATNSIAGGNNLPLMKRVADESTIWNAWRDEPWVVDGAAVRVALICFGEVPAGGMSLDGRDVSEIRATLRAGLTLSDAVRLEENKKVSFIGTQKNGPFDISGETAREWLLAPTNPNGKKNSEVIKPWTNGAGLTRRDPDFWVIDFGPSMPEEDAALFELPFGHVVRAVKPTRLHLRRDWHRTRWWLHGDPRPAMRRALAAVARQIVTPRVSKHRLFLWRPSALVPDSAVVAIARDDDTTFGILHSRFHELWSLRMGTWLGKGNDPRYTPTTTFETFPFPEGLTPNNPAAEYAADPRAKKIAEAAARLNELRENWLNPADLVRREPEVIEGYPDRILPVDEAAAKELKKRTLTNLYNQRPAWLEHAHNALDEAVAEAYGWPVDLSDDEVLARLFQLNQERAGEEDNG